VSVGVIIVAAGRGARMSATVPKQLLDLGGTTVLRRAIAAFDAHPRVDRMVVVLPADLVAGAASIVGATARPCGIAAGGARRQDSVRLGLAAMASDVDLVLVHDAARPFVSAALIDRVIDRARDTGAAVPALPARDTVKHVDPAAGVVRATLRRDEIWLAQTPQGFRRDVLTSAVAFGADITDATDEAMLAERAGHTVAVVNGEADNVKITTPEDLAAARRALAAVPRVGTGYDLHVLAPGRTLVLAGVVIPAERGPVGHSDADVVCHALADAIFGACAAGDIGRHFPDSDPRWKDAAGVDLLGRAAATARDRGWVVASADVTVVLERPKLAPFMDRIRHALAGALATDVDRVSVKAKTNEGVDAVGRGEAIAAHAVVVLAPGPPA
jgi:2-C-methyl-D-erythritol 4-phosphate cytidylyltransferase/2-C-methyl-D-erythritol 2,4-cyclodiphosphate synthase